MTEGTKALLFATIGKYNDASECLNALSKDLTEMSEACTDNLEMVALNGDVSGRMLKSIDGNARFSRWGRHYLRALCRSHQLMQQTNYMDKGLQVYGGPLFNKLKESGGKAFQLIPLPVKPKAPVYNASTSSYTAPTS